VLLLQEQNDTLALGVVCGGDVHSDPLKAGYGIVAQNGFAQIVHAPAFAHGVDEFHEGVIITGL